MRIAALEKQIKIKESEHNESKDPVRELLGVRRRRGP